MTASPHLRAAGLLALASAFALSAAASASPAPASTTFTVTTVADEVDLAPGDGLCAAASGECSLRAAVMEANAGAGPTTIVLADTTYPLNLIGAGEDDSRTGDLDVHADVTLLGSGMTLTFIEGMALQDRAIQVHLGARFRLQRTSVLFADAGAAQDGGGMLNQGDAAIVESSFQYNTGADGGGLKNTGTLTVSQSLLWANTARGVGAGLDNDGVLELHGTTLAQNYAVAGGGGMANSGQAVVLNSTISSNTSLDRAAAILNESGASLRLNNTTVVANSVPPGAAAPTGGIANAPSGSVAISNTIVSANAAETGYSNCTGLLTSGGFNLFGAMAGCTLDGDTTGNLTGVDDPLLGALTENPDHTASHPPLPGSPAINAGNPAELGSGPTACEPVDQRGWARPLGLVCDIGAYESEHGAIGTPSWTPPATVAPTSTPTHTPTPLPTATAPPPWTVGSTVEIGAFFGGAVAFADSDADTYPDVVVGAGSHSDGQFNEGAAFLYAGSAAGPQPDPAWSVQSNQAFAVLGTPLDSAGDVNGDGYEDLIVAAYQYSHGQASEGVVFGYYGSASGPRSVPDWMAEGNQAGGAFGWSVAGAGDVNGDGYDDVVVGARTFDGAAADEGAAFLYLGSPSGLQLSPVWQVGGTAARVGMGYAVTGAGDVNGDGYDDVLVSAVRMEPLENEGSVYLFFGSPSGLMTSPSWSIDHALPNDGFGADLAPAGDVDQDGYDDFLVGAPGSEVNGTPGRAYLFRGSATGPGTAPAWVGSDGTVSSRFGAAVASAGDFNADRFLDLVVGAPNYYIGGGYGVVGRLGLYLGSASGFSTTPDWTFYGQNYSDFASALATAKDTNGDGYDDLLVGAQNWDNQPFGEGRVFVFFGWPLTATAPPPTPGPTLTPWPSRTPTSTPTDTHTFVPSPTPTSTPTSTPRPAPLFSDDFESGDLTAWSSARTDDGDLNASPAAAIGGNFGLEAVVDDNRAIYVVDETPASESAYRSRFYFDPNGITMASGNTHTIFLARAASGLAAFRLDFRSFQGDYQVRAVAPLDAAPGYATPWSTLGDGPHFLEVNWFAASGPHTGDGGLTLEIDGRLVAGDNGLDNDSRRIDQVRLGAVGGIDGGTRGATFFDSFVSTRGEPIGPDPSIILPSPTPPPPAIFDDGFESGDLSAWSAVRNPADLLVTPGAALRGAFGLEVAVDDTAPRYLTDWSPFSETSYYARFRFDPNGLTMLDGRTHQIFVALAGASQPVARIELRFKGGAYGIRGGIRTNGSGWVSGPWAVLSDEPHRIEFEWTAAMAGSDGSLFVRVDGVERTAVSTVDNGGHRIDLIHLGAVAGVDTGTVGAMFFDDFVSRRGPELYAP